jgi:hypothetical protein
MHPINDMGLNSFNFCGCLTIEMSAMKEEEIALGSLALL